MDSQTKNECRNPSDSEGSTDDLFGLVYDELHRIASQMMGSERADHTLSATALVNEAYLRLRPGEFAGYQSWDSRGHFFSSAAEAMRRILIDAARSKAAKKRNRVRQHIELDTISATSVEDFDWVIEVDEALCRLDAEDSLAAEFVKLRLFAGQSVVDAGKLLKLSKWSSYELWKFALAWFAVNTGQETS